MCCIIFGLPEETKKAKQTFTAFRNLLDLFGVRLGWTWVEDMIKYNANLKAILEEWNDLPSLLAIGGNRVTSRHRGYIDIVTDESDSEYHKLYVGQAKMRFPRIGDHLKELRTTNGTENSQHNRIAEPNSLPSEATLVSTSHRRSATL